MKNEAFEAWINTVPPEFFHMQNGVALQEAFEAGQAAERKKLEEKVKLIDEEIDVLKGFIPDSPTDNRALSVIEGLEKAKELLK
jgi:hypothetical protein